MGRGEKYEQLIRSSHLLVADLNKEAERLRAVAQASPKNTARTVLVGIERSAERIETIAMFLGRELDQHSPEPAIIKGLAQLGGVAMTIALAFVASFAGALAGGSDATVEVTLRADQCAALAEEIIDEFGDGEADADANQLSEEPEDASDADRAPVERSQPFEGDTPPPDDWLERQKFDERKAPPVSREEARRGRSGLGGSPRGANAGEMVLAVRQALVEIEELLRVVEPFVHPGAEPISATPLFELKALTLSIVSNAANAGVVLKPAPADRLLPGSAEVTELVEWARETEAALRTRRNSLVHDAAD